MKSVVIIIIIILCCAWINAYSTVIRIPQDYLTIQGGINASTPGDTVLISEGTYFENLNVTHSLNLFGVNRDSTIIDGSNSGSVVCITADYVNVCSLNIVNSGDLYDDAAVKLNSVDSCLINYCMISNSTSGVRLNDSNYNTITCSFIYVNDYGITFCENPTAPFNDNIGNQIIYNSITANYIYGIYLEHTTVTHHNSSLIKGNLLAANGNGISMIMSESNNIINNDIHYNPNYGISHSMCLGGGMNNNFYHNNFIDNNNGGVQASDFGNGTDYWYSASIGEGNYWSDYTGPDTNQNGIGDIPYDIDGNESQDMFPLMNRRYAVLEGTVTNVYGNPIYDVFIMLEGISMPMYTDSSGFYRYSALYAGFYDMTFMHDDFMTEYNIATGTAPGDTTIVDIVMRSSGCYYYVGDINNSGFTNGVDVTYGVAYFKGGPHPPYDCECTPGNFWYVAGDVNGSNSFDGLDIVCLVNYFKGYITTLAPPPNCPPPLE